MYTELIMFQPLERTLTTAFCRKPLENSLLSTHPPLPLYFSLTGGVSCFFSSSPLCPRPRPRCQDGGATSLAGGKAPRLPALGQRPAWRPKVTSSSPIPPRKAAHRRRTGLPAAVVARSRQRPCSGDPRASQTAGSAQGASPPPQERAQARGYAPQLPDPRSLRWRHGTAAHGGANRVPAQATTSQSNP
jgi:hypothetical protein